MNNEHFEDDVKKAIEVMEQGGIILYPTDTIWGIGCDATKEMAVRRIFDLKQREDSKSMIILVALASPASEIVGFCTMLTLKPSFFRMS